VKVGDLVKHIGRHEYSFWEGKFGIVIEMCPEEATVYTTHVHWFGEPQRDWDWFRPEYLEVFNEGR
jgi:hypothetical protein|tara:strand:+ start:681 stop:878 length:198 start_codon:yes stop_codon:yes gene_type:complete